MNDKKLPGRQEPATLNKLRCLDFGMYKVFIANKMDLQQVELNYFRANFLLCQKPNEKGEEGSEVNAFLYGVECQTQNQ